LVLLFAFDTASVPDEFIESGRTFGLTRWQIVYRIVLPDRVILMSAYPGTILDAFVPLLAKPRTRDYLTTPEFKSLYDQILERFPAQVLKA
jgi:ABC-type nitrate/sulfonate/bicarbonate transport system ATPase subunit